MRRIIALLVAAGALTFGVALAPGVAEAAVVGHVRVAIDSNASFPNYAWTADHEQVVVLPSWDLGQLYALKAASPNVKVLMYKNVSAASSSFSGDGDISSGVSYTQAASNGWLLRNTNGSPFTFQGYSWLWAVNVGSSSYQQAWTTDVLNELRSAPWDGVLLDDVNPTIRYHYCVSCVAEYPSDTRYASAMGSFVENVGPRLRAAGKLAIANLGSWSSYSSVVDPWLKYLGGAMDEEFVKWGDQPGSGYAGPGMWAIQLQELKDTEKAGKLFIGITHSSNGDARAAVYGYATELLEGDGKAEFAMTGDYSGEPWFSEYNYKLGSPVGAYSEKSSGVYERRFQSGLVVVNPTLDRVTVSLGAAYSGSGLSDATKTTLAPQSALVLLRSNSPAAAIIARAGRPASGQASGRVRHGHLRRDRGRRRHHRRHRRRHSRRHRARRA
jgi:Hypothetical glycosyl hydrolase family 15